MRFLEHRNRVHINFTKVKLALANKRRFARPISKRLIYGILSAEREDFRGFAELRQ